MKRFPIFKPNLRVKVIGVGSGACRVVDRMLNHNAFGVEYVSIDTDALVLMHASNPHTIQLGDGRSTGGNPLVATNAALEKSEEIKHTLKDAELVFVVSCLGRGTGSGASPIIANIAKELGALTVGIISHPFQFEGNHRAKTADSARLQIKAATNTIIPIQNENLLGKIRRPDSLHNSFRMTDGVIESAIRCVMELVTISGEINIDFADIRTMLDKGGQARMCTGAAFGSNRALLATQHALTADLQENNIDGACGLLANITTSSTYPMRTEEFETIGRLLEARCHPDADIKIGFATDDCVGDALRLTILATNCQSASTPITNITPEQAEVSPPPTPIITDPPPAPKPNPIPTFFRRKSSRPTPINTTRPTEESARAESGFWKNLPAHLR